MKKTILLAFSSLLAWHSNAQVFPVDTLQYKGSTDQFINLVILGDGYTAAQIPQFRTDATNFKNYFFTQPPFSNYVNYFNVFTIEVPSNESGADHPNTAPDCPVPPIATTNPDNYYGSTFDYFSIHRLLVPVSMSKISNVLAANLPDYDQVVILTNSTEYGGSGGAYATTSLHSSANEIAVHEIGHSFGFLADEYWAGSAFAAEKPNMTQETDPSLVKWEEWMNFDGTGIYENGSGTGWYKPHQSCKMQALGYPFCPVCKEALTERIHTLTNPIVDFIPSDLYIEAGNSFINFQITTMKPVPNTLKTDWKLDGATYAAQTETVVLDEAALSPGTHQLVAYVIDTTGNVRDNSHQFLHLYDVQWTIQKNTSGIAITGEQRNVTIRVFPNPSGGDYSITAELDQPSEIMIELLDKHGKLIRQTDEQAFEAGMHQLEIPESQDLPAGMYVVRFTVNGTVISRKIMKL